MPVDAHVPVLCEDVLACLGPSLRGTGRTTFLDCTLGLGGHARALLDLAGPETHLIGMDADESNLRLAKQTLAPYQDRVRLFHGNFAQAHEALDACQTPRVDALLADLGFSSNQMDSPERGFSFQADGPLDMRLDRTGETTAADLVNRLEEAELADLIYQHGEERHSRRIARAIVEARQDRRIETTARLTEIVLGATSGGRRPGRKGIHPATRTFQALRIAVNDELGNLDRLLANLPDLLNRGGRAAIISFHSLEDRRVKQAFAHLAGTGQATILTKKPITAGAAEVQANPRSRSAKLRAMERIG